jgi:hypothetical protein
MTLHDPEHPKTDLADRYIDFAAIFDRKLRHEATFVKHEDGYSRDWPCS